MRSLQLQGLQGGEANIISHTCDKSYCSKLYFNEIILSLIIKPLQIMSLNKRAETHTLSLTKSAAGSNFAPARISYIDFEIDFVGLVNVVFIN